MRLLILTAIALLAAEARSAESIVLVLSNRTVEGEAVEFLSNSVVLRTKAGEVDTISMMDVEVAGFRGASIPYPTVPALLKIGQSQALAPEGPTVDSLALRVASLEGQIQRHHAYHRLHGGFLIASAVVGASIGVVAGLPILPVLVIAVPTGLWGTYEITAATPATEVEGDRR